MLQYFIVVLACAFPVDNIYHFVMCLSSAYALYWNSCSFLELISYLNSLVYLLLTFQHSLCTLETNPFDCCMVCKYFLSVSFSFHYLNRVGFRGKDFNIDKVQFIYFFIYKSDFWFQVQKLLACLQLSQIYLSTKVFILSCFMF